MSPDLKTFCLALFAFGVATGAGCKHSANKSAFEIEEEKRENEIQMKVAPFALRYHARVDWSKGLDHPWTIAIQDSLKETPGPVVFVGTQEDVERRGERYFIRLDIRSPWSQDGQISLRAECPESIARRAAGIPKSGRHWRKVAVVVNVRSVTRPRFKVEGQMEDGGTVDAYADTVIVEGDSLAIDGECLDWMLIDAQD